MGRELRGEESLKRHISLAIFANLLSALISTGAFVLVDNLYRKSSPEQPTSKLFAILAAIALWCVSYSVLVLLVRHGKPIRENLKYIGYYFPLTAPFFWARDEQILRRKAEEKLQTAEQKLQTAEEKLQTAEQTLQTKEQKLQTAERTLETIEERIRRLERILKNWPDVLIIAGIIDPKKQEDTLSQIMDNVDTLDDHLLAQIFEHIRLYSDEILGSVGANGNYDLFRQIVNKVSLLEPDARPETHMMFSWLLLKIFRMPPKGCFTRKVQKDMIAPLKSLISRVDRSHLSHVEPIIEQIMADEEDEQDLARHILITLLDLDWTTKQELCQIIFNESKKRAFQFPVNFGLDFLSVLLQLEHKVFWLNLRSLQDILEQAIRNDERGLINLRRNTYDQLCSTVFARLENSEIPGLRNTRVFRRLSGDKGRVKANCTFTNGDVCDCEGESLSFRGLYSRKCDHKVSEKMKIEIIPIEEIGLPKPEHKFTLAASVAKLHLVEAGKQSAGRGVFFEEGAEKDVKELYDYISSR